VIHVDHKQLKREKQIHVDLFKPEKWGGGGGWVG